MYNLYVGGEYNWNTNKWTAYGDEATGMQDSNMLGENYRSTIASGVTAYSSVSSEYNGSIVEGYVNNYKDLLEYNFDVDIVDARLAVIDEFVENAGCIFDDIYEPVLCEDAYSFVKQTVFWTSSIAEDVNRLYYYDLDRFTANREYYDKEIAGVRPVIIVSRNDIIVDNDPYASGSLDDIGTIVSFGDQYFYTIGSDKDNVKLLSMYNLDVGNEVTYIDFDGDGSVIMNPLQNPTGIQKHNMMGFKILTFPYYGTIAFSNVSSDYNGSLAELHVNNYKSYLETKNNIVIKEARLMSYEENDFFCVENNNLCDSLPNFLFFGSYWIDVPNGDKLLAIGNGGMVLYPEYYVDYLFGIRPVIIVSKDYFK